VDPVPPDRAAAFPHWAAPSPTTEPDAWRCPESSEFARVLGCRAPDDQTDSAGPAAGLTIMTDERSQSLRAP